MPYQVSRNGQTYGPYTLEDLQRYVASGNILLTDLAKSEDMPTGSPSPRSSTSAQPACRLRSPSTHSANYSLPPSPSPTRPISMGTRSRFSVSSPAASSVVVWNLVIALLGKPRPSD